MHVALVVKAEMTRPGETPSRRRDDSVKIDLKEIGLEGVDWTSEWRTVVNTVMKMRGIS